MHFLFSLLRIKSLYMFRALLAHPQEVLHSDTWYIACVLYQLAAARTEVELVSWLQPTEITRTQYTNVALAPPEDEQVMLETGRGP
jgi:hypothetical protein